MKRINTASAFYAGTLISSIGSFSFNASMIAFMIGAGFKLWNASLILGLNRLLFVVVMTSLGHITDRTSPKVTVLVTELIASLASLCLFFLWQGSETNYVLFASFCIARGAVVSFQIGSRAKISKYLSDETYAQNSKNAIWLNKATQGATLFGGLIGFLIIKHFSFKTAIVFDGCTFLINGVLTLLLPTFQDEGVKEQIQISWHSKFKDLFAFNKKAAVLDVLLAVAMMGTVAFQSRMAGDDQSWTGLYLASFGLAVWISGFLERSVASRVATVPFWFILSTMYFTLGFLHGPGVVTLISMFVKDLAYWMIYHRISAHILADTPKAYAGSIASARAAIMVTILAVGEILVGAWANVVSVTWDASIRALIVLVVGCALFTFNQKRDVLDERPSF